MNWSERVEDKFDPQKSDQPNLHFVRVPEGLNTDKTVIWQTVRVLWLITRFVRPLEKQLFFATTFGRLNFDFTPFYPSSLAKLD